MCINLIFSLAQFLENPRTSSQTSLHNVWILIAAEFFNSGIDCINSRAFVANASFLPSPDTICTIICNSEKTVNVERKMFEFANISIIIQLIFYDCLLFWHATRSNHLNVQKRSIEIIVRAFRIISYNNLFKLLPLFLDIKEAESCVSSIPIYIL